MRFAQPYPLDVGRKRELALQCVSYPLRPFPRYHQRATFLHSLTITPGTRRSRPGEFFKAKTIEGTFPHHLTLTVAVGFMVGIITLSWRATLLRALVDVRLCLKHVVMQAPNSLVYMVKIAMFLSFYWLGERIIPKGLFPCPLSS